MVQRDKSCYLLKIKRSLGSWKKPLLEPFALSALSVEIPGCKTWKWPSPTALGFTFIRKSKKNQSIKVSAWKIRHSVSCSSRAGEISEVMGGKHHPAGSDPGATACQLLWHPPGVVGGCVSPGFPDWADAGRLICSRNIARTCQLSPCKEHSLASPPAQLNTLCCAWLPCQGALSFFSLLNTDISK